MVLRQSENRIEFGELRKKTEATSLMARLYSTSGCVKVPKKVRTWKVVGEGRAVSAKGYAVDVGQRPDG